MIIEFNDNLRTGNQLIDTQHEELVNRIQAFVNACEMGDSKVNAIKMLDYMDEYTNFHFSAEEKLQEEVGYPELNIHKAKHDEFKQTVAELYKFLDELDGPNEAFVAQVKKNVVDWLFNHIQTFDRSVADFVFYQKFPGNFTE